MNSISYTNTNLIPHIVIEDYFALKVVYDSSVESTKYVGFYFGDTDLLEFSIDREFNTIKRFQLVLCNHFEIMGMELQSTNISEDGCISIGLPQHNECDSFNVRVYRNAVEILLSNKAVHRIIKSGQVLFCLSSDNELVNVTISEMTEYEIKHTIEELNMGYANE